MSRVRFYHSNSQWCGSLLLLLLKVTQSCLTLCDPMDYTVPSPGDLPNPGIKPRSHTLQVDSLPAEPQGKPYKLTKRHVGRYTYVH